MKEPNPPTWPASVKLIRPTDDMEKVKSILKEAEDSWNVDHGCFTSDYHFSSRRLALMFAPGVYRGIDIEIGYYAQILGLGVDPDSVQFRECDKGPHVPALNKHLSVHHKHGSSLDTFWRSAENFSIFPSSKKMLWAVSQAAPLRRVHVGSDLHLCDGGAYASGGFMANCRIDGDTDFGGQQQWLSRSCHFDKAVRGGAWSLVFVGCSGEVPTERRGSSTEASISTESTVPVIMEKPYIAMKEDGVQYELRIPKASRRNIAPCWDSSNEEVHDFSRVFVANADDDDVGIKIQAALDNGKHVVFTPGIFKLDKTIHVRKDNLVLLGIGFATLLSPSNGSPCIAVSPSISGVRIAGIMLEVSEQSETSVESSSLLEWGAPKAKYNEKCENPSGLFDIFCRVGGNTEGDRKKYHVNCIMRIHADNVIGDNLWLWRADHAKLMEGELPNFEPIPMYHQTEEDEYGVKHGIHVTGNDVTIYGLAVEHTNEHQTVWSGNRGHVYFYQCELPYDVRHGSFGEKGYVGYLIDKDVEHHKVVAPGIYSNFRNEEVVVETAIRHPGRDTIFCTNPFTVHLDNNGYIKSIVNGIGEPAVNEGIPQRL